MEEALLFLNHFEDLKIEPARELQAEGVAEEPSLCGSQSRSLAEMERFVRLVAF